MNKTTLYPDWKEKIVYGTDGPEPQILMINEKVKVILAVLKPGQKIPNHPDPQSIYHFLEGSGWMIVDGERIPVTAGAIIVMPDGSVRGMEAETELAFIGTRMIA